MISFDRKAGNVNLTPLWDEIYSIKSDTSSLWDFLSTITGVDIDSSIMSSLSSITNSLASLSSETSSIASDTAGLNMDVVSLYNFSSVMTSSISDIINSLSTMTGGSGGGPYYLALSDATASSLHYVYNMTGNLDSLPYNSIKFYGSMGTFKSYTIPTTINKISISELDLMNTILLSYNNTNADISLNAKTISANTFKTIGYLNLSASLLTSNSLTNISNISMDCIDIKTNTIGQCLGVINALNMGKCDISSFYGIINIDRNMTSNTIRKCSSINAMYVGQNLFDSNYIPIMNANTFINNTFNSNIITPNINCATFGNNVMRLMNDITVNAMYRMSNNVFSASFDNTSQNTSDINLQVNGSIYSNNSILSIDKINLNCVSFAGNNNFDNINEVYFDKVKYFQSTVQTHGSTTAKPVINTFNNIKLVDAHNIDIPVNCYFETVIGVETMRLNYDWNWNFLSSFNLQNIQPTNIYTLDFYNCEDYIGGSTFTIPSFYSGYDDANVWISGKPLVDYSYTLSVSN